MPESPKRSSSNSKNPVKRTQWRTETSRHRIDIANGQFCLLLDLERLRAIGTRLLEHEGVLDAEISVALVSDDVMHGVNNDFLGHDYTTDVVSFALDVTEPVSPPPHDAPLGWGKRLSGEVVICTDYAIREAATVRWSPHDEVALYLVHGLLHICGYDDLNTAARKRMRRREREILAEWQIQPRFLQDGG